MHRACLPLLLLFAVPSAQAGIRFNFSSPDPISSEVSSGFEQAGKRWSSRFSNDIDVNVSIGFHPLGAGILGQTSFSYDLATYADVAAALKDSSRPVIALETAKSLPAGSIGTMLNRTAQNPNGAFSVTPYVDNNGSANNTTLYFTTANGKALGLLNPHGSKSDALIEFNSSFQFDFNPADGVDAGKYDFVGVATHELGHALGFISAVDDLDESDLPEEDVEGLMTPLDLFRFSARSAKIKPGLRDWSDDIEPKYFSVDGGKTALAGFTTGERFGDGEQASHWKKALPGVPPAGIMNPSVTKGDEELITDTDLLAFTAIGYNPVPEAFTWIGGGFFAAVALLRARRRAV